MCPSLISLSEWPRSGSKGRWSCPTIIVCPWWGSSRIADGRRLSASPAERRHSFHEKPTGNARLARSRPGCQHRPTRTMREHRLKVADVFRTYEKEFFAQWGHVLGPHQRKAFEAIRDCRTAALGGHVEYVEQCDTCGHRVISYNSCRDRHCPKCQALARAKWLAERETELLPAPYFHVVFTLPQKIGGLALQN